MLGTRRINECGLGIVRKFFFSVKGKGLMSRTKLAKNEERKKNILGKENRRSQRTVWQMSYGQ